MTACVHMSQGGVDERERGELKRVEGARREAAALAKTSVIQERRKRLETEIEQRGAPEESSRHRVFGREEIKRLDGAVASAPGT